MFKGFCQCKLGTSDEEKSFITLTPGRQAVDRVRRKGQRFQQQLQVHFYLSFYDRNLQLSLDKLLHGLKDVMHCGKCLW